MISNSMHSAATDDRKKKLPPWHSKTADDALLQLGSDGTAGLSAQEAESRLRQYGPNLLETSTSTTWYRVFGRQFLDILIWILVGAAVVSLAMGEWTDAITILVIVILNGLLGFVQEWKAERALEGLRKMLRPHCLVIRDGTEIEIDSKSVVPGDLVRLETGWRIPADLRLVESQELKVDESALTGESLAVNKQAGPVAVDTMLAERSCMAWMGTDVAHGRALGVVIATAENTEFGRIAGLTEAISGEKTPLQRKLTTLGKQLSVVALGVSILVALIGWLMGKPALEMFFTGVSLAVAVVPEGLPAVVTLTLALGIRAMVRRRVLLRRLQAAEGLGAATVVCTDKTGTLTQNEMTVQRIWLPDGEIQVTGVGYDPAGHFELDGNKLNYRDRPDLLNLLRSAATCNHAHLQRGEEGWQITGQPTEAALIVAAFKAWLDPLQNGITEAEFTFDSNRKRMTIVERVDDRLIAHTKGAPEIILPRCTRIVAAGQERSLSDADLQSIHQINQEMTDSGLRTLAIGSRSLSPSCAVEEGEVEQQLTLLGIVGMMDPPRPEVPDAIRMARCAGVKVVMVTGDAASTAVALGRKIGLSADLTIDGQTLTEMNDDQLSQALTQQVLFARTTPEHKLRIVNRLQADGHIVGMTGDGVNDAPALKKADIGIAMGIRGTDVAKGAADIVLTDDNFSSIIGAIEEGRRQYDNIQKFVRYLLSSNTGEIVAILLNIVMGGPLILLPVQILWMNLVTDGLTALALGVEPAEKSVMQRPPLDPKSRVLNLPAVGMIFLLGSYVGLATLWLFHYCLSSANPETVAVAGTVAFTGIILVEKMNVLNFRSLNRNMTLAGLFSNRWLWLAIVSMIGLQACAVYVPFLQNALHTVPLRWSDWALMFVVAAPVILLGELIKWFRAKWSTTKDVDKIHKSLEPDPRRN